MTRYLAWRAAGLAATIAAWFGIMALLLPPQEGLFTSESAAAIAARLPVTLPLALLSLILALGIALPSALAAARRPDGRLDRLLTWKARLAIVVAPMWLGMVLVIVVAGTWRLLPAAGFIPWHQNAGGALASLLLPAIALAVPLTGAALRLLRRALAGIEDAPPVLAARFAGLGSGHAIMRHGMPMALARLAPQAGPTLFLAICGAMIVENVFYLPGLGRLLVEAVTDGDLDTVRNLALLLVAAGALVQFAADLTRAHVDRALLAERGP